MRLNVSLDNLGSLYQSAQSQEVKRILWEAKQDKEHNQQAREAMEHYETRMSKQRAAQDTTDLQMQLPIVLSSAVIVDVPTQEERSNAGGRNGNIRAAGVVLL